MRMREFLVGDCYGLRIGNRERMCDVNICGEKKMKFIGCDERKGLCYINVMKDYEGKEGMVLGRSCLDIDDFKRLEFCRDDSFLSVDE